MKHVTVLYYCRNVFFLSVMHFMDLASNPSSIILQYDVESCKMIRKLLFQVSTYVATWIL